MSCEVIIEHFSTSSLSIFSLIWRRFFLQCQQVSVRSFLQNILKKIEVNIVRVVGLKSFK